MMIWPSVSGPAGQVYERDEANTEIQLLCYYVDQLCQNILREK